MTGISILTWLKGHENGKKIPGVNFHLDAYHHITSLTVALYSLPNMYCLHHVTFIVKLHARVNRYSQQVVRPLLLFIARTNHGPTDIFVSIYRGEISIRAKLFHNSNSSFQYVVNYILYGVLILACHSLFIPASVTFCYNNCTLTQMPTLFCKPILLMNTIQWQFLSPGWLFITFSFFPIFFTTAKAFLKSKDCLITQPRRTTLSCNTVCIRLQYSSYIWCSKLRTRT